MQTTEPPPLPSEFVNAAVTAIVDDVARDGWGHTPQLFNLYHHAPRADETPRLVYRLVPVPQTSWRHGHPEAVLMALTDELSTPEALYNLSGDPHWHAWRGSVLVAEARLLSDDIEYGAVADVGTLHTEASPDALAQHPLLTLVRIAVAVVPDQHEHTSAARIWAVTSDSRTPPVWDAEGLPYSHAASLGSVIDHMYGLAMATHHVKTRILNHPKAARAAAQPDGSDAST